MKEFQPNTDVVRIGNGFFNRRQFLALSAVTGGGLALAACGTDSGSSETGDTTGDGGSTNVKTTLRVGMNSSSVAESLTPVAIQGYVWSQMLGFVFYDPLIKKDEQGNLVPCIATEWDTSDPTKTILKIREGVTFHDGSPLTAADVAYSIAVRSDPTLIETTQGRPIMTPDQWVSATAVDDTTVEVVTTERVEFLINPQPVLVIQNESFGKVNYANEVNGTGPYRLGSFTSGTGVECVANDVYWDGVPSVTNLSFTFYQDPATSATSLKSGQVDALYDVAPANIDSVSDVDGTVVTEMGTYAFWWIVQMGKEPLNDPEVRKALRHCFDVEAINQASFKGRGKFSWNPFKLFTVNSGADAEVEFDPAKAKEILAGLGKSDITVPILCIEGYNDGVSAAQVMQQSFQAAGIKCEVEVAPAQDWLDRTYGKGTWEGITFNAGNLPFPSKNFFDYLVNPSTILSAYKKGDVVEDAAALYREINATPFDSPEIDDLLAKAEKMIVDDAIVFMGLGAGVGLVLPEGVSGVVTNGFGDVFWDKAIFSA